MLSARRLFASCSVVLAMADVAAGQLTVDQRNTAPTNLSAFCANQQSLYQSFKPRISPLAAIELEVYLVPVLGDWTELRLRRASPGGDVVAESRVFAAADGWLRFDLAAPLPVAVGSVYVIEWLRPYGWMYNDDDPYDAGWGCNCIAAPRLDWDFHFRTLAGGIGLQATTWSRLKSLYGD
jgi:hypothetical protein